MLAAAHRLFLGGGIQCLTMQAVAREAGVSRVTVYAHFNDLPGLIRALVLEQQGQMTRILDDLPTNAETLRQRLLAFGLHLTDYLTSDDYLDTLRLLASQAPNHPWLGPILYRDGTAATVAKLARLLEEAVRRGDLRAHDCAASAEQLIGMWQGTQTTALLLGGCPHPSAEQLRRRVERSIDLILKMHAVPSTLDSPLAHS